MDPVLGQLLVAFVVGIPAMLVAFGGIVATVLLHKRGDRKLTAEMEKAAADRTATSAAATVKLEKIEHLANGTLTVANERIERLETMINKLLEQRGRQNGSIQARSSDP